MRAHVVHRVGCVSRASDPAERYREVLVRLGAEGEATARRAVEEIALVLPPPVVVRLVGRLAAAGATGTHDVLAVVAAVAPGPRRCGP